MVASKFGCINIPSQDFLWLAFIETLKMTRTSTVLSFSFQALLSLLLLKYLHSSTSVFLSCILQRPEANDTFPYSFTAFTFPQFIHFPHFLSFITYLLKLLTSMLFIIYLFILPAQEGLNSPVCLTCVSTY